MVTSERLILASQSAARRSMLTGAGVPFTAQDAGVDEAVIKAASSGLDLVRLAQELARAKALAVSRHDSDAWVLGSDQILDVEGSMVSKVPTLHQAAERLRLLRGKTHHLHSAAALARGGSVVWSGVDTARMTMRPFSEGFLRLYLEAEGEGLLGSVGCYRLEGMGSQLFDRAEGDYFTILGMPLWPVLAELRRAGVISV